MSVIRESSAFKRGVRAPFTKLNQARARSVELLGKLHIGPLRLVRRKEPGTPKQSEIESKFAADKVSWEDFAAWAGKLNPVHEQRVGGVDTFYRQGKNVLRHRVGALDDLHELTTKILTSKKSSTLREEPEVHLNSSPEDVEYLLESVGWKKELAIDKMSLMFDVIDNGVKIEFCIYDARGIAGKALKKPEQRFIEVEVEKNADIPVEEALQIVHKWENRLRAQFGLAKPMNGSLYDAFGGKGYRTAR